MNSAHAHEIQPADPEARRRALILLTVMTPIGFIGIALVASYVGDISDISGIPDGELDATRRRLSRLLLVTTGFGALICVSTAAYVARMCSLALRAQRFPPPGVPTVREMRIMRGRKAKQMAVFGLAFSGMLALAGLALPLLVWRLLTLLVPQA